MGWNIGLSIAAGHEVLLKLLDQMTIEWEIEEEQLLKLVKYQLSEKWEDHYPQNTLHDFHDLKLLYRITE